jgi:hypothetical protein
LSAFGIFYLLNTLEAGGLGNIEYPALKNMLNKSLGQARKGG